MKLIHKYPLEMGLSELELSVDADLLCVKEQNNIPVMYVLENPNATKKARGIFVQVTGASVPPKYRYIGTVMLAKYFHGVVHVFEVP